MIVRLTVTTIVAITATLLIMVGTEQQASEAVFPGTNGKIAFTNFDGNHFDVWTMGADGAGRTKLSSSPGGAASQPAFSPDGEPIAFHLSSLSDPPGVYTIGAGGAGPPDRRSRQPARR